MTLIGEPSRIIIDVDQVDCAEDSLKTYHSEWTIVGMNGAFAEGLATLIIPRCMELECWMISTVRPQ